MRFQFTTGNQIINRYVASRWLSGGRKLKTDYYTYVVPLAIPLDSGKVITNPKYIVNVVNLSGTSYVDDAEYTRRSDGLTYANGGKVYNSEGYTNGDGLTAYSYYRKDHLGNNREVWYPNTTAQRTEYYPSGLPWSEGLNPSTQEHKYNGKEFIKMDGYDTYDYGARGYYPAMWRFTSVDPLCEMKPWQSPYMYCIGNQVNRTEVTGLNDLPGVTVTAPDLSKNKSNSSSPSTHFIDIANRNTPQILRLTPPTPSFNLPINPIINNVLIKNKDLEKENSTLQNISDALAAIGLSSSNVNIVTKNYAGEEIVYVTIEGTNAIVQTEKVLTVLKGVTNATIVLWVTIDFIHAAIVPSFMDKAKFNTTITIVAVIIGGAVSAPAGIVISGGYLFLDKLGAFTPYNINSNYQKPITPQDATRVIIR